MVAVPIIPIIKWWLSLLFNNRYTFVEYMCSQRTKLRSKKRCPTKQIVADLIEEKVWEILEGKIAIPDMYQDFEIKRGFLLKHITKIIHHKDDTFTLNGLVNKSEFKVKESITNVDRHKKRLEGLRNIL